MCAGGCRCQEAQKTQHGDGHEGVDTTKGRVFEVKGDYVSGQTEGKKIYFEFRHV